MEVIEDIMEKLKPYFCNFANKNLEFNNDGERVIITNKDFNWPKIHISIKIDSNRKYYVFLVLDKGSKIQFLEVEEENFEKLFFQAYDMFEKLMMRNFTIK